MFSMIFLVNWLSSTMITVYAVIAVVLLITLTVIGILKRYKKCRSDEVLVVYGKTKGNTSAKCYHGGGAFVWPVVQGYAVMSMKPMQIQCDLNGVLSSQKIKVNVPTVVTVAISEKPEVMINAAIRLLGLTEDERENQIKDIIWGQMRLVVAEMSVEQLISDRENFIGSCRKNIELELEKLGLSLINIVISDITDEAEYIINLGKEAASKAKYEALASIEKREKEGVIGIETQKKERAVQLSEIERDKQISVKENEKTQAIKTAEIDKNKQTVTSETNKDRDIQLREIEKNRNVELVLRDKEEAVQTSEIEKERTVQVATYEAAAEQEKNDQVRLKDMKINEQNTERDAAINEQNANRDVKIAEQNAASKIAQEKALKDQEAATVEFEQNSKARKESATQRSIAEIEKATQEKEASVSEYESSKRKRQASANKEAKLSENTAGIEVAKSDAKLGVERSEADKQIGEARAASLQAVGIAEAKRDMEIFKAQRAAKEEELKSTTIVETEIEAERVKKEADGKKAAAIATAEGESESILLVAQAKAKAIQLEKEANAAGELAMAKALVEKAKSETSQITALKEAGIGDGAIASFMLREQYAGMIGAQTAMFEHLNLGEVKVIGDASAAGNFLTNVVKAVQEGNILRDQIPGFTGVLGKLAEFDKKNGGDINKDPEDIKPEGDK